MTNKFISSRLLHSVTFSGDDLPEVMISVVNWMKTVTPSGHSQEENFDNMTYQYDSEFYHQIIIYHTELK